MESVASPSGHRVFFDTEFTAFREGRLLSVGLVTETGSECYAELGLFAGETVNDFVRTQVLSQFGKVPGAAVSTPAELGQRVGAFLSALTGELLLCFDYKLDRVLLEDALRRSTHWPQLEPRLAWRDVAHELSAPACRLASVLFLSQAQGPLFAHHALLDARALRHGWASRVQPMPDMLARAWLYLGYDGGDHRGRPLQAVLAASDEDLERVHDYIQWVFPLDGPSAYNDQAPVLDATQLTLIGTDPNVRRRVTLAFARMLRFYGLYQDPDTLRVQKASTWAERCDNWAFFPGHNDLRISRILRSLCLLGRRDLATAFLAALEDLASECRGLAKGRPLQFWRQAVR